MFLFESFHNLFNLYRSLLQLATLFALLLKEPRHLTEALSYTATQRFTSLLGERSNTHGAERT